MQYVMFYFNVKPSQSVNGTESAGGAASKKRAREIKQKAINGPTPPGGPSGTNTNATGVYNISNFPVKKIVCTHWKAGKCIYGDRCRYSHAIEVCIVFQLCLALMLELSSFDTHTDNPAR